MNKRILTYIGFVIAVVIVLAAFLTATSYLQLVSAIILYPVLVFYMFRLIPCKTRSYQVATAAAVSPAPTAVSAAEVTEKARLGIADVDKRVFLKLIGGVGVSLFLFSIFNKRAEGLFFKNVPAGPTGTVSLEGLDGKKIDPAQKQPTDGYRISEVDDNMVTFYGFTNKDGGWFIMREDAESGSFRYTKGDSNFPNYWTDREKLSFDYYNNVF